MDGGGGCMVHMYLSKISDGAQKPCEKKNSNLNMQMVHAPIRLLSTSTGGGVMLLMRGILAIRLTTGMTCHYVGLDSWKRPHGANLGCTWFICNIA